MPERHERLKLFQYEPPQWSLGDWLHVTLDFADEPSMRSALADTPLASTSDWRLREGRMDVAGISLSLAVYGPALRVEIAAEARGEFLTPLHYDAAEQLEAALAPRVDPGDVTHRDFAWPTTAPAPRRASRSDGRWLVRLEREERAIVVRKLGAPAHRAPFDALELTAETRWLTSAGTSALAFATATVGRRHDGSMGAVAATVEPLVPSAELADRATAIASLLGERDDLAVEYLVARAEGFERPFERWVADRLRAPLFVRRPSELGELASVMHAHLRLCADAKLPVLFRATRTLDAALAEDRSPRELLAFTLDATTESLRATADRRRSLTVRFATDDEDVHVLAERPLLEALARVGLVTAIS